MARLENSTYLDFTSHRTNDKATVVEAFNLDPSEIHVAPGDATINVALCLARANDPAALLSQDWATRQTKLAEMQADGTLWSTFGSDPAAYDALVQQLQDNGITTLESGEGYVSSAEARTVWVSLNAEQFENLFGTPLMVVGDPDDPDMAFWNGDLSLPAGWQVDLDGLWLDLPAQGAVSNLASDPVGLAQGPQSIGNASGDQAVLTPAEIAELYDFPLTGSEVATGTVGLIETGIGDALPQDASSDFQARLDDYREAIGIDGNGSYYVNSPLAQAYDEETAGERSLDVGVVAGASSNSTIGLYAGSGPEGTVFTSFQSAIWDLENNPEVISSSFADTVAPSPDSPFLAAYRELFVDAALRNLSMFNMSFDGGSGNEVANGLTNVFSTLSSPYAVTVGGTSISTPAAALDDETLEELVALVDEHDLDVLQTLIAGGLHALPENAPETAVLVETVWNQYNLQGSELSNDYTGNAAGSGGVDPTQETPWYQLALGAVPVTADPLAEPGRGVPDVSAQAGGNMFYHVPQADMLGLEGSGGTSASTPLWASLGAQINAVFADQGLPQLGYMNDLLYTAAVVAPAAFNDVRLGNNVSSFVLGGDITGDEPDEPISLTPTGFGYEAGPGYDLTTGLGTPDGTLLARALTAIAHRQLHSEQPGVLGDDGTGTATQSLLLQPILASDDTIEVETSESSLVFDGVAGSAHAWSSRFAQQALQADFDAELVRLFDGQSQVRPHELVLDEGSFLSVEIGGDESAMPQASLSNDHGFIDYVAEGLDSALQVARSVAVATTAGGMDDQEAIVRLRQNGKEEVALLFYEVDDFTGRIDGLAPGQDGYDQVALERAYVGADGDSWIEGPGFGEFLQTSIMHVDAGDLIAMQLVTDTDTFFAFAEANEEVDGAAMTHLWNYGLNSWGWEDQKGGGDLDYNDIVVQLDFISAFGSGLVA